MSSKYRLGVAAAVALSLAAPALQAADTQSEQQSLDELRNTVVNLLQALVEKGLLTREQAQALVKNAQTRAATEAATEAAKNATDSKDDENAIRVPYVPQIIKDEISKQVAEEVKPQVVQSVVAEAKTEKWGIPGALPDWLDRVKPFGDVTFRGQSDMYSKDNGQFLDYSAINTAGGFLKATYPFLNTTENRDRLRVRARLGLDAQLSPNFSSEIRLSSGSLTDPSSESQNEGAYGARYTVGLDRAYIRWNSAAPGQFSMGMVEGGRFENPWFSPTQLVYARDLQFEGVAGSFRWGFGDGAIDRSNVFINLGAVPELEVPTEISQSKWLLGAQLGTHLRWADGTQRLTFAGAYYDFTHVTGEPNTPDSTLTNVTAPAFIRYGNTMYDISNSTTDPTVNLFALAAHFRLADVAATYEYAFPRYLLTISGEAVRNVGYKLAQIRALTPQSPISSAQDHGYVADISFGDPVLERWSWRGRVGYRYVQSDAVIDAWTDADFHEGGTNASGYYIWGDLGLAKNIWLEARYFSGNEITPGSAYVGGLARYGVDIVQLDMNARF